jgi:acyl carrier protein
MSDPTRDVQLLRSFISANFYLPADQPLDEHTSFLKQGIIDSTGVLELVSFVESQFGLKIEDHELLPTNFDSIAALSQFINRKRSSSDVLRI